MPDPHSVLLIHIYTRFGCRNFHNCIEKNDVVIFDDFGLRPLDNNF